jgi:DNA polymerase-1
VNFYLIDGNSYVYRAFYAIKSLSTSQGIPTNAVYGFTTMLLKIIRDKKPDNLIISFDSPVPTERHKLYEAYKAQRPETPEDLLEQLPHIKEIISSFRIEVFEIPGYEADDILGTIARKAADKGIDAYIVTGDKDMLQLVDERIKVYDPMKDRVLDKEYVRKRYGVGPAKITDFMALTGDPVDNIPGIKGVGEKTAKELLAEFEDIEDMLSHTEKIRREKLRLLVSEYADVVRLSKKLATIDTSVPVDIDMEKVHLKEPDWHALMLLFKDLEFGSLLKRIPSEATGDAQHEMICSREKVREVASSVQETVAMQIVATSSNPLEGNLVGIAISIGKGRGLYIPVSNRDPAATVKLEMREVLEDMRRIFEDEQIAKIGHNLKYDIMVLSREGIKVKGRLCDIMVASYLMTPNKMNHSLEEVALEYLSYRKKTYHEVLEKKDSFAEVPLEEVSVFASENAHLCLELSEVLVQGMKENALETVFYDIEMPLVYVLADMEAIGVKIDVQNLSTISKELDRELDSMQKRIYFLAGEEFNINSPKQLSRILFQNLGLQPKKKTKTGYSTEMSVLEALAKSHELPGEILNYRTLSKLKTTYIDVLPRLINDRTGRIHTSFNQTVTATGRLSSSDPNLQNIPVRGEWGKRMRETFIAEDGNLLLSADYSQIELRILAHLSQDEGLMDAFSNNYDIHARTASEIFRIPIDTINQEMRRIAKTVNFGIIYGISPFGLSETLRISREDAKVYIDQYFRRHPGVKSYIERTIEDARRAGYVATLFGRRRPVPEIKSRNITVRQQGERLVINSPVQGTAADIIKIAMVNIWKEFNGRGLEAKIILQVHDELLFELPGSELEIVTEIVKRHMEGVLSLSIPLRVDIKHGKNWAEVH